MQSDELGIIYSHSSGYDPRVMKDFFRKLKARERFAGTGYHGFLATHPDTIERIISSEDKANIIAARGGNLERLEDNYKSKIEELPYGGDSSNKFAKPDRYIHIYTIKNGDTFRSISKDIAKDERVAFEVALINGKNVDDKLTAGEKIKVIMKKP